MERLAERLGLGRTTTFIAHVTIHELSQVPLVSGRFKVDWKYKGATSDKIGSPFDYHHAQSTKPGAGAGAASASASASGAGPGAGAGAISGSGTGTGTSSSGLAPAANINDVRSPMTPTPSNPRGEHNHPSNMLHPLSALHQTRTTSTERGGAPSIESHFSVSTSTSSGPITSEHQRRSPLPRSTSGPSYESDTLKSPTTPSLGDYAKTPNPNRTPVVGYAQTFQRHASGASAQQSFGSPGLNDRDDQDQDEPSASGHGRRASIPTVSYVSVDHTEPKGSTTWAPLRAHTATFNRVVSCPVAIPLKSIRSSSSSSSLPSTTAAATPRHILQPSSLKLRVRQEVPGDEEGKMKEVKTGQLVLDLSQFVTLAKGKEPTARRYLLRDCKTNATLRVTVRMEFLAGERTFVAPPLKTGQIAASSRSGVATSTNSPFSRSTTSLIKDNKNVARSITHGGSTMETPAMSRTNSVTSISTHDGRSSTSPATSSNPKKGWRPTVSAQWPSMSPSAGSLGIRHESERSANEIIDVIFSPSDHWKSPFPTTPHYERSGLHQQMDFPNRSAEELNHGTDGGARHSSSTGGDVSSTGEATTQIKRDKKTWRFMPLSRKMPLTGTPESLSPVTRSDDVLGTYPGNGSLRPSPSRQSSMRSETSATRHKWHAGENEPRNESTENSEPKAHAGATSATRPIGDPKYLDRSKREDSSGSSINGRPKLNVVTSSERMTRGQVRGPEGAAAASGQALSKNGQTRNASGTSTGASSYHSTASHEHRIYSSCTTSSSSASSSNHSDSEDEGSDNFDVDDSGNRGLTRIARLARAPSSNPLYGGPAGLKSMKLRVQEVGKDAFGFGTSPKKAKEKERENKSEGTRSTSGADPTGTGMGTGTGKLVWNESWK
ncbi:BZ3500_MvSof-1268-A1-R1_Chr6-3g09002 [Microbotryum saponariae]|uniref:BZ3500_MvSof-1268-A1-R1_Chr6-3g09002 protein n=1 Tax=Microbotryum saponariae TaxID=289078 RepID=A0A2X0MPU2_9BASI|nr:BZ3500_MvSof-1268-A1-R1_Chr6-3g09002 [Microbotryum saponariae]SDA07604.1 BZ3501_MvSof-1269-A2-R1_Chr6-2g08706 [Microbotryum saponariae]